MHNIHDIISNCNQNVYILVLKGVPKILNFKL